MDDFLGRVFAAILALICGVVPASAGFRTPESLVRNVYAYYGSGAPDLSHGLPRDEATTQKFFDPSLRKAWRSVSHEPYDFLVQSATWNLVCGAARSADYRLVNSRWDWPGALHCTDRRRSSGRSGGHGWGMRRTRPCARPCAWSATGACVAMHHNKIDMNWQPKMARRSS